MRRDTQGPREPCGPTRAPAWRGGDMWHAYLYLIVTIGVIVHISILYSEFELTSIFNACYIPDMLL